MMKSRRIATDTRNVSSENDPATARVETLKIHT
jgi:hypothetical protein